MHLSKISKFLKWKVPILNWYISFLFCHTRILYILWLVASTCYLRRSISVDNVHLKLLKKNEMLKRLIENLSLKSIMYSLYSYWTWNVHLKFRVLHATIVVFYWYKHITFILKLQGFEPKHHYSKSTIKYLMKQKQQSLYLIIWY